MDTRNCPVCDTPNPTAARFCTNCGATMATTTETIALQTPPAPQQVQYPPQPAAPPQQVQYPPQPAAPPQQVQYPPQPYQPQGQYPPQVQGQYPPQPYQPQGQYPPQPYQQPGQVQQPYQQPQINVVVNTQATAVAQNIAPGVIVKQKSVLIAFLLTFFFGPFGLFYVTVRGAIIFLLITLVLSIMTAGVFWVLACIISMIWAPIAASNYNKAIIIR